MIISKKEFYQTVQAAAFDVDYKRGKISKKKWIKEHAKLEAEGFIPDGPPFIVSATDLLALQKYKKLVGQLLELLNSTEFSEGNNRKFHPTTISSCRVTHTEKLRKIIPALEKLNAK